MLALQLQESTERRASPSACEQLVKEHAGRLALPEHVMRLNRMIDDPSCSASDIAAAVERSPELSDGLPPIARAAGLGPAASAAETVVRLGARQARDLLLAAAAIRCLPAEGAALDAVWRHGLAAAMLARDLATAMQVRRTERYFLIGLFHNVGLPALHHLAPGAARAVLESPPAQRAAVAREQLGFEPSELGVALLRHWRLPEPVTAAVACLNAPERAECYRPEAAIGRLACAMAGTIVEPPCGAPRAERLDLPAVELEVLASAARERLSPLATAMGLGGGA